MIDPKLAIAIEGVRLSLEDQLKANTGQAWTVLARSDHLDFQFLCRTGDFKRLTQSYDVVGLTVPGPDELVRRAVEIIGGMWRAWEKKHAAQA